MRFFNRCPKAPEPTVPALVEPPNVGEEIKLDDAEQSAAQREWRRENQSQARLFHQAGVAMPDMGGWSSVQETNAMAAGLKSTAEVRLRIGDLRGAAESAMKSYVMKLMYKSEAKAQGVNVSASSPGALELELLSEIYEAYGDLPRAISFLDAFRNGVKEMASTMPGDQWLDFIDSRREKLLGEYAQTGIRMIEPEIDPEDFEEAAKFCSLEYVTGFLDAGVPVEGAQANGYQPIHAAAENGRLDVLRLLIDAGADVDAINDFHQTPMLYAASEGQSAVIEFLDSAGGGIDTPSEEGRTALHVAAAYGHSDCVEVLIALGADVDVKGKDGRTALHRASVNGYDDVVELLLEAGADPTIVDDDDHTYDELNPAVEINDDAI